MDIGRLLAIPATHNRSLSSKPPNLGFPRLRGITMISYLLFPSCLDVNQSTQLRLKSLSVGNDGDVDVVNADDCQDIIHNNLDLARDMASIHILAILHSLMKAVTNIHRFARCCLHNNIPNANFHSTLTFRS